MPLERLALMKTYVRVISLAGFKNVPFTGVVASVILASTLHGMESAVQVGLPVNLDSVEVSRAKGNFRLGQMLAKGEGCIQSYEKAREHFEVAAEQDYDLEVQAWACMQLAKLYYFGYGAEKNQEKMRGYLETSCAIAHKLDGLKEITVLAEILKSQNFDVHARSSDGDTPLHRYVIEGYDEVVEVLLDHGADVNAVDSNGLTPLYRAALFGCKEIVKVLLDHGAAVNAVNTRVTPLHVACSTGNKDFKEVVLMMLDRGANVNAVKPKTGSTPLHLAAVWGRKEVAVALLNNNAVVNAVDAQGQTPLYRAVSSGHTEVVEVLLANGADVNIKSHSGKTAFDVAGQDDIRSLLQNSKK